MTEQLGLNAADVALIVGITQCSLIFYGLKRMEQTGQRRDKQLDQQDRKFAELVAENHLQNRAPERLLERTA